MSLFSGRFLPSAPLGGTPPCVLRKGQHRETSGCSLAAPTKACSPAPFLAGRPRALFADCPPQRPWVGEMPYYQENHYSLRTMCQSYRQASAWHPLISRV